jgi:hypothetical protein
VRTHYSLNLMMSKEINPPVLLRKSLESIYFFFQKSFLILPKNMFMWEQRFVWKDVTFNY